MMMMMVPICFFFIIKGVRSQCPNRCNGNGLCGGSRCECFEGYEGVDCSLRSCPKGRAWSDTSGHSLSECSNRGYCVDGLCECDEIFEGLACERLKCDCSGHGECVSGLSGYEGCECDPGFTGFDCSRLACEKGDDRRTSGGKHETIELFCRCENCTFSLLFQGEESRTLEGSQSSTDLSQALKAMRSLTSTSGIVYPEPIEVRGDATLCSQEGSTTLVDFKRDSGNLPPFTVLPEIDDDDDVYFVTKQTLNCSSETTGGYFSLELEGRLTELIRFDATPREIQDALAPIKEANVSGTGNLCPGNQFVVTILDAKTQPSFIAWQSFLSQNTPLLQGLEVVTRDGTREREYCNNAGFCDETGERTALNGTCQCDPGFVFDIDFGTCGRPVYNTSAWTGVQRCAGYVVQDLIIDPNNDLFLYLMDMVNTSSSLENDNNSSLVGGLFVDHLTPDPVSGSYLVDHRFNKTTNLSGVALDLTYRHLYYVDSSIGGVQKRDLSAAPKNSSSSEDTALFSGLSTTLEGITLNLLFGERSGYVTDPGILGVDDGAIYVFDLDDTTTIKRLDVKASDPRGIALDLEHRTMYWCDSMNNTVYRANLDGSSVIAVLQRGLRHPVGLVLDLRNYTMIVADQGQLVKADMAFQLRADDSNLPYYQNQTWYQIIATDYVDDFGDFRSLRQPFGVVIDTSRDYLYWTDFGGVYYSDTNGTFGDIYPRRFQAHSHPKGLAIDNGLGPPEFYNHECYGHGYCGGPELNFRCVCDDGWFGNCNMSHCPSGPSWFFLDDDAQQVAECSNAGICDLATGSCNCRQGFEGAACERLKCPHDCSGHGNCLTMRQASLDEEYSEWDADRIMHCVCHTQGYWNGTMQNLSDWTGYDCSRRTCPTGDVAERPTTSNGTLKSFEVQRLTCLGQGTFSLTFRQETTREMSHDDLGNTLLQNLLALETIGTLSVSPLSSALCNNASFDVTFTSELGDLPLMTADTTHLQGNVSLHEIVQGTKEDEVCSLHGICDHATGECRCFDNYLSSDADGNFGLRNDCGHAGHPGSSE